MTEPSNPDAAPVPGSGDGTGDAPYDPFRYGRPEPGSPAAAAYPHLFPPAPPAPSPGAAYPPAYPPPGSTYSLPAGYAPPPVPGSGYGPAGYRSYGSPDSAPTSNGKATTGLVLGLVSVPGVIFTALDLLFICIPGIVFSLLGLGAARRGAPGKAKAVWGLVLSILTAMAIVAVFVVAIPRYHGCDSRYPNHGDDFTRCLFHLSKSD